MKSKRDKWIEAGYEIFALNGPSGLRIEHLAENVGISKSSFYHFFADLDCFIEELLEYHFRRAQMIADKENKCANIDPELISILVEHKLDLLFSRQLRIRKATEPYNSFFEKSNSSISSSIIDLWSKEIGLANKDIAQDVFDLAIENFYMQISYENINYLWLSNYFRSIESVVASIKKSSV